MTRQPQGDQAYYEDEEEYYEEPGGTKVTPAMIVAIIMGVLALAMLILMLVMWSGHSTSKSKLQAEMVTNNRRRKENEELKLTGKKLRAKIQIARNAAIRTRADNPGEAIAKAKSGSAAYWKAKFEDAKREQKGHEMQARKWKMKVESGGGKAKPDGSSPAPAGSMGVPGT